MKTMQKKNKFLSISIFVLLLSIVLFPQFIKYESMLIMFITFFICMIKKTKFRIDNTVWLWIAYILLGMLSAFVSPYADFNNAIETLVSFFMALFISIMIFDLDTCISHIKYIYILTVIILLSACLQVVFPGFICEFNKIHLSPEKFAMFYDFFRGGYLVGFSFQTAVVAFYCSIFVGINTSYFLCFKNENSKLKNIFLLAGSFLALIIIFFTSKRSFIIYALFLIFFLCYFFYRGHRIKIIGYSSVFSIVIYEMFINTHAGQRMIERSKGDSLTTGRNILIDRMIKYFWNRPIIGNGLASTLTLITDHANGHNIYIQILSETGILGFMLLIPFFIINIIENFKGLKNNFENNRKCFVFCSCLCIQVIFLLWGFTGNPLYDVYPLLVYMTSVGIVWSMKYNS